MTKDEALKLALEALKQIDEAMPFPVAKLAQAAIKEALAQQDSKDKEQAKTDSFVRQLDEALAQPWEKFCDSNCVWTDHHPDCKLAQRKPLTDEEALELWNKHEKHWRFENNVLAFARAIEAAHGIKEKNT